MLDSPLIASDAVRLRRLRQLELLDTPGDATLDAFTALAARGTGCPIALISLVDEDRQWFKSAVGLPQGTQTSRRVSFCGHAIADEGVFEVEDARDDPRFHDNPLVIGAPDVVHYAGVPLTMPEGERIGTLCVIDHAPGRLDDRQKGLLQTLAQGVVDTMLLREERRALTREQQLTHSETLADFAPVGICNVDADGAVVHANPLWSRLLGIDDQVGALGWGWMEAVHPSHKLVLQRDWMAAVAAGLPFESQFRVESRWLRVKLAPTHNDRGITPFVAALIDVSLQQNLADELSDRTRSLSTALQVTGLGLWEYAPERDALYLSDDWAKRFNFAAGGGTMPLAALAHVSPPETIRRFLEALGDVLSGRQDRLDIIHDMKDAAGQVIWCHTRGEVVERDPDGRALRLVGTSKDVTERVTHQQALEAEVARADAATQAKAEFLATMSHEIRTPINGVVGLARMLAGATLPPKEAGWVRMIGNCANTLLALINDVLDHSKIEAGQMTVEQVETDLHALLRELAELFAMQAAQKQLAFSMDLPAHVPPYVITDPLRLRQILMNLLGNAQKFTETGGYGLAVDVESTVSGRMLVIRVSDTGRGMTTESLGRLFNRYQQGEVSTARLHQGTGLGLAIARDLARLLGGDIQVESAMGQGTTFTVRVLLKEGTGAPQVDAIPADGSTSASGLRILLVDDDEINRLVGTALLAGLGYRNVNTAFDGVEAVERVMKDDYDVVFMDCLMPRLDGTEATRQLRALGVTVPVIALSAGAHVDDRDNCFAAGMNGYLTKPVRPSDLQAVLEGLPSAMTIRSA